MHILDIAENSIRADATLITINVSRDIGKDLLRIEVVDNGRGMDAGTLARVRDPFFTTKGKKTGLGIPFLAQAAEMAGGTLAIDSQPGAGTQVAVTFGWSNVDRPAIGNIADTLIALIAGHPGIDVLYVEQDHDCTFRFDTRDIKAELDDVPINAAEALNAIRGLLREEIKIK